MFSRIKNLFQKSNEVDAGPGETFVVQAPTPSIGKIEQTSSTWVFIEAWAQKEIEMLRKKNDNLKASEQQTTIYRAEIRFLKKLLALSETDEKHNGGSGLLNI